MAHIITEYTKICSNLNWGPSFSTAPLNVSPVGSPDVPLFGGNSQSVVNSLQDMFYTVCLLY
jgi:hypothetical protein